MKKFPHQTLFKLNTQGKIEQWSITVFNDNETKKPQAGYTVTYGEHAGKMQTKTTVVKAGKNIGKKNETTPLDQAIAEAKAKWEKQLKKGYVMNLKDAEAGKTDDIIKGGILPMLAHSYDDYQDKVEFPCYVQPKLDGERCVAIWKGRKVTLWTRSRKQILSCPHIEEQVALILNDYDEAIFLDGELYHHDLKDQFEELMSAVRKQKPSEKSMKVEFHIYDCGTHPNGETTSERQAFLESLPDYHTHVKFVPTNILYNHKELELAHDHFVDSGYEGIMVRTLNGVYENKRSKHLLKFKKFQDAEFPIVDCIPGKDSTVIFVLEKDDVQFKATMSGNKEKNQIYLKKPSLWKGKQLTVKFQTLTGKNKVPRFPVGLRIRNDL